MVYPSSWSFDQVFDSLEQGCGDFLLELRRVAGALAPGAVLMVASRDAGATIEIPAWCRLTGHHLLEAAPPYYLIRMRDDPREE